MTATRTSTVAFKDHDPVHLLGQQVEICLQLERFSGDLLDQLKQGQSDEAMPLLDARRPLVDELCRLNRQFAACCPSWPAHLATLGPAPRREAETLAGRFDDLLQRVRTIDALLSERLSEIRTEVSDALGELLTGRNSNRAYVTGTTAAAAPGRTRFMDRRG
ncbi:MAG: flagellar protein FliT [Phycisphaerales bacterium]|nr:flagellar protein FliT [Phycisphaerales bacterium]